MPLLTQIIIVIVLAVVFDVGVTAWAYWMTKHPPTAAFKDPFWQSFWPDFSDPFWSSFWSGLASNLWVGSVTALIIGVIVWLLQESWQERRRRSDENAKMHSDAIALANGLYAEFPAKPVSLTNSETAAQRFEAEQQQTQSRILSPILDDKAVDCAPLAARRMYQKIKNASPMVWRADSPVASLTYFFTEFVAAYDRMLFAARTLDYRLAYHARRLNGGAADDIRSEADRCYFIGKLLGYSDARLLEILAAEDPEEQGALPKRHARLKKVSALEQPGQDFAAGLQRVQELMVSLRDTPRTVPSAYRGMILSDSPWRTP